MFGMGVLGANLLRGGGGAIANAATLSPNYKHDDLILSNGNLTATHSATNNQYEHCGTIHADPTAKLYCEVTIDNVGTGTADTGVAVGNYLAPVGGTFLGSVGDHSVLYHRDGRIIKGSGAIASGAAYTTGDVIGVRVDGPAGAVAFRKNGGAWTADQTVSGPLILMLQTYSTGAQMTVNFGATAFTQESPSGFTAWPIRTRDHRYWRHHAIANNNAQSVVAEVELRLTAGGGDQTGSGTASSLSSFASPTYDADKAFDNDTGTIAHSANNAGANWWLQYDFGSGVTKEITEVVMTARSDNLNYPTDFRFVDSDDGTTFFPLLAKYAQTWSLGETKTFAGLGE